MSGPWAVEVADLRHVYPAPAKTQELRPPALDGVDLKIASGGVFGLLGPNGGGKTTLCRILTTSLIPSGGSARILGLDALARPADVRRRIGVVFQYPSLDRKLTVRENLMHQGRLYGLRGAALRERIAANLREVGLEDRSGDLVETLSGGLRRRAELAKSLLHRPELLVLDEPSAGLDPGAQRDFWDYVTRLRRQEGLTVLVATHLMDEAERCDRLAILDRGRVLVQGSPDELKRAVGGDVLSIRTPEPERLSEEIRAKFNLQPARIDDTLHIERPQGHAFIPTLVEAFPGRITSITYAKPTLEDVFIHCTGRVIAPGTAQAEHDLARGTGRVIAPSTARAERDLARDTRRGDEK